MSENETKQEHTTAWIEIHVGVIECTCGHRADDYNFPSNTVWACPVCGIEWETPTGVELQEAP